MKKVEIAALLTILFLTTSLAIAEGTITEQQKQIPENKGVIIIELPEQKKNVNIAPGSIMPRDKGLIQPAEQNVILKTNSLDNEQTFPAKPKYNFGGRYYIPLEGSSDWIAEKVRNTIQGISWDSCCDDLFINRPGDSWNDTSKVFNFQFATAISSLAFIYFNKTDGKKLEDRGKAYCATAVHMALIEWSNASSSKNHFCAKNLGAGLAGAACGSFLVTIGSGF